MGSQYAWKTTRLKRELDKRGIKHYYSTKLPQYGRPHDTLHFWVGRHDFCVSIDDTDQCLYVDSSAFPVFLANPELRTEITLTELLNIIDKATKKEEE